MPVGCNALNSFQLVAGCDFHKQIPPPPPAGPLPMAPHVVVYCMGFAMPSTAKKSTTVKAGWGYALGRQHDLGMGIYHFAANILLPLVWAGAANKAEFGSGSVKIDVGGEGLRMAVAVVPMVGINVQLDCNEPCAMPTSICIASLNTVKAGFSLGDFVAGFLAGCLDVLVTYISGKIAGAILKGAGAIVEGILAEVAGGITAMLGAGIVAAAFPTATYVLGAVASQLVGWAVGSPLGYSYSWAPGSVYGGKANDALNDWLSQKIDGPKALPPGGSPTPTSAAPPTLPAPPPTGSSPPPPTSTPDPQPGPPPTPPHEDDSE